MEDQDQKELEPIRTIAERVFPEETAEILQRKQVWVNSKWLNSDNKKAEKFNTAPEQEKILWGKCICGEVIYRGDSVGMYGEHMRVICYTCWLSGKFPECHLDCAGLCFPDSTLSQ